MYIAITEKFAMIKQVAIARIVGITEQTMCRIVNQKQGCSKRTAYCIVKAIHPEAEIEEYFTIKRKEK